MTDEEIESKIAVIFATDVVGYSKHIEIDESGTIKKSSSMRNFIYRFIVETQRSFIQHGQRLLLGRIYKCSICGKMCGRLSKWYQRPKCQT